MDMDLFMNDFFDDFLIDNDDIRQEHDNAVGLTTDTYSQTDFHFSPKLNETSTTQPSIDLTCVKQPVDGYQPKSLSLENSSNRRWTILPKFPSESFEEITSQYLLLTNVPELKLSTEELVRRRYNYEDYVCYENESMDPTSQQHTHILYELFVRLSKKWRVPISILASNYELMTSSMGQLALADFVNRVPLLQFTIKEWKLALEFYLQMDVDCFFLKTCSFRHSLPRLLDYITYNENEGLFCMDVPEARYGLKKCFYRNCLICHVPPTLPRYEPGLKFVDEYVHTFVNQYQAYLNCDVTCSSTNVIYSLTCPCRQYDFVGRTKAQFSVRLYYHRLECARIIRESLLGRDIVEYMTPPTSRTDKTQVNNAMDLYRHIAHCSAALEIFVHAHPMYLCFVPMKTIDADVDDDLFENMSITQSLLSTTDNMRSDDIVQWCITHVPSPPDGFRFSKRQLHDQHHFFKMHYDQVELSRHFDIYNVAIVAALPEQCSSDLLHFVQALLVTHAECKLNTNTPQLPSHFERASTWCC